MLLSKRGIQKRLFSCISQSSSEKQSNRNLYMYVFVCVYVCVRVDKEAERFIIRNQLT